MGVRGFTATILWTQFREALLADAPDLGERAILARFLPIQAGPATRALICQVAEDLTKET